jgi:signal transduction histidine kinase
MSISKFLEPPAYDDPEKNRVANLMHLILLFNGVFIFLLLIGFLASGLSQVRNIAPIVVSFFIYFIFYVLLKKGYVNLSAFSFVIVSYLVLTIVILVYGGVQVPHLFLYFVTIVIASAVLPEFYAIATYVLVMVSAIVMYWAENAGLLPTFFVPILDISSLVILGSNLVIMASIIYLSNRSFRQALRLYKDELETRKKAEKEILQLNLELEQRVQERTSQLEDANKELETFSYSVSHDLRAPLRAMSGFASIVLENTKDDIDDESVGYLIRIENAAQKMDLIIKGLLDLSRISRENLKIDDVNLSRIAREIVSDLPSRELKQEAIIKIDEGIHTKGDERLLRVLLLNLINNAWKFSRDRKKASIEFSVVEDDGQRIFSVKDNGVGFDRSYTQKLFTPFQRLHSESEFEGSGIGLATCKKIVQRHGGEIWAESEVGKGATFFFTLSKQEN